MSTPFLQGFAAALVQALLERELLEVVAGGERDTVAHLAGWLSSKAQGGSVVSSTVQALVNCPHVEELYADNAEIIAVMETLRYGQ